MISLYRELRFSVGGLAIEEDTKALFDVNETWSNENYNLTNLKFENNLRKFHAILVDQTLKNKLPDEQYTSINNSGLQLTDT